MTLQYPQNLWYLLILLPITAIQIRGYFRSRKSLARLMGGAIPERMATIYYVKWFFSSFFFLVGLFLLLFSLTGVSWGERPIEDTRTGLDVIFLVDVSNSMQARDISPSRQQRGIELMRGLIAAVPDARYAVYGFKGESSLFIPLTENRYAFDSLEHILHPDSITAPWTHIDRALTELLPVFSQGSSRHQVLVLLSDGENHGRSVLAPAREYAERGIPVLALTLGTTEGSTIPGGSAGTPLRDNRDQVVITRANPALMQDIASVTGGRHILADEPGAIGNMIGFLEDKAGGSSGFRLAAVPKYRSLLAFALFFFLAGELVRIIRWKGIL